MNDDHPPEEENSAQATAAGLLASLAMGLRFYSRLPLGTLPDPPPELNRIALTLPATSLVIGFVPALLLTVLVLLGLPGAFAAVLAVTAALAITGAMAEDGLADAADGVFGGTTASRRLEIMRDSRHGTYGVLALILVVLARVLALGALAAAHPIAAGAAWLGATILARSGSLWPAVVLPPARTEGLSAAVGGVTRAMFIVGMGLAAVIGAILMAPVGGVLGILFSAAVIAGIAVGWTQICKRLVGGQTGDLIGALQALLETAALAVLLALA